MAPRTDFLTQQRRQIDTRLQELKPAHEEYLTLLEAKQALEGLKTPSSAPSSGSSTGTRTPARRGPGRPPGSGRKRRATAAPPAPGRTGGAPPPRAPAATARGTPRRTRRRAGGTRGDQAMELIKANPGIGVAEIANRMGIRQNYLYRVTAALQKQGSVKRQGQGFVAP